MSRIGQKPVSVPDKVKVSFNDKERLLKVSGPKGELEQDVKDGIEFDISDKEVKVTRKGEAKSIRALHGLYRSLLNNMVIGVSDGFTKVLELHGVGYRAQHSDNSLNIQVGYSHPVKYDLPKEVSGQVKDNTVIELSSFDKQLLGQIAAEIRSIRPPEPYKKKGIRYKGEHIRAKAGKSGKK